MRICVIGLGSMGKRRIKLLKLLRSDLIITGIDNNTKRVESVAEEYGIECYSNLSDIVEKLDCAFVCTPPNLHASIINECLENNLHVFSEINLIDNLYEENMKLAKQKGKVLFLSSIDGLLCLFFRLFFCFNIIPWSRALTRTWNQ